MQEQHITISSHLSCDAVTGLIFMMLYSISQYEGGLTYLNLKCEAVLGFPFERSNKPRIMAQPLLQVNIGLLVD